MWARGRRRWRCRREARRANRSTGRFEDRGPHSCPTIRQKTGPRLAAARWLSRPSGRRENVAGLSVILATTLMVATSGPTPSLSLRCPPGKKTSARSRKKPRGREALQLSQLESRDAELRSRRLEEQLKFREELREVIRTKGHQAGAEIADLDKRYGYEVDQEKFDHALRIWKYGRMDQRAKVNFIRSLDVPETAILGFMCSSIHGQIGTRDGPRDENEVRVRAARQLLHYDFRARPRRGGPVTVPVRARRPRGRPLSRHRDEHSLLDRIIALCTT